MDHSLTNQPNEGGRGEEETSAQNQRQRYSQTAHHSQQPPVTILIPKRRFTWTVLLGLGLSLIVAVQASYGWIYVQQSRLPRWPILNPQSAGSFASWLSSSLLLLGAIGCLLTYGLRRHRIDDYRGGYRYWLWAASAFILGSVNTSVAVHELLGDALGTTAQLSALGAWVLIGSVLLFLLAPEVICSRLATTSMLVAFGAYAFATSIGLGLLWPPAEPLSIIASSSASMLGHLSLVAAVGFYVRYVYLDAHELLPVRPAATVSDDEGEKANTTRQRRASGASKREKTAKSKRPARKSDLDDEEVDSDEELQPTNSTAKKSSSPSSNGKTANAKPHGREPLPTPKSKRAAEMQPDDEDVDMQSLSKSERRRLRKLKRRKAA